MGFHASTSLEMNVLVPPGSKKPAGSECAALFRWKFSTWEDCQVRREYEVGNFDHLRSEFAFYVLKFLKEISKFQNFYAIREDNVYTLAIRVLERDIGLIWLKELLGFQIM